MNLNRLVNSPASIQHRALMPNVSVEDLGRPVVQLNRSDKGRLAMRDLLTFLENGGISLDADNQLHVACLLVGA